MKIIFIYKKNYYGNYNLIYHNQFHKEASTIATHLPTYLYKKYSSKILTLFNSHYQELATNCIQKDGIPMYKEEQDLEDVIAHKIFEWDIKIEEEKPKKKLVQIVEVGSVGSWNTTDFKKSPVVDISIPPTC